MRATWIIAVLAAAAGGCELVSGLDRLSVGDASTADACSTCDAGSDQSALDARSDGDSASDGALSIQCGDASCTHGVCCRSSPNGAVQSYTCMDSSQACAGVAIPCDSENDCPGGQICCAVPTGTSCSFSIECIDAPTCFAGAGSQELCSSTNPTCADPQKKCGPYQCLIGYSSCQ